MALLKRARVEDQAARASKFYLRGRIEEGTHLDNDLTDKTPSHRYPVCVC